MIGEDFSRNITSTPDNLSACLADSTLNMGLSFQRPISVKTFFWQGSLVSLGPLVSLSSLVSLILLSVCLTKYTLNMGLSFQIKKIQ